MSQSLVVLGKWTHGGGLRDQHLAPTFGPEPGPWPSLCMRRVNPDKRQEGGRGAGSRLKMGHSSSTMRRMKTDAQVAPFELLSGSMGCS